MCFYVAVGLTFALNLSCWTMFWDFSETKAMGSGVKEIKSDEPGLVGHNEVKTYSASHGYADSEWKIS